MRGAKGKLICIWSPVLHGEGCSTLACSIGFGMQHCTEGKILIVNKSNSNSHMEKYVEKDIEIKYSMDNLKIFNTELRKEHILTYATQVNSGLFMIAGARLNKEITNENASFDKLFVDRCLEGFDVVIIDMDTRVREDNKIYLDCADRIIAVVTPNEIILDELYKQHGMEEIHKYFVSEKTIKVFNKLYENWELDKVIKRIKSRYKISDIFGLNYDGDILNACCAEKNFYSFLMNEIKLERNSYVKQLMDICSYLSEELCMEKSTIDYIASGGFIKRLLRISLY
jgi:cellulose biosynthesis protein BcsQ